MCFFKDVTIFSATSEQSAIIIVEFCRCQSLNTVTKPLFNSGVTTSLLDFISLEIHNTLQYGEVYCASLPGRAESLNLSCFSSRCVAIIAMGVRQVASECPGLFPHDT